MFSGNLRSMLFGEIGFLFVLPVGDFFPISTFD